MTIEFRTISLHLNYPSSCEQTLSFPSTFPPTRPSSKQNPVPPDPGIERRRLKKVGYKFILGELELWSFQMVV